MTSKNEPKWKRFENLVAHVQSLVSPDAEVMTNERVRGRQSNALRQLDIVIKKKVGQFEIIIVIDCKDDSEPVDVKGVEEFIGLVEDIGANKGALVAANGFTKAAKIRAKNSGIELYRLVDAEEHDWKAYISIPVVCDFRGLGTIRFGFRGPQLILQEIAQQDPKLLPIFDENQECIGTPLTLLWEKWNGREVPNEPGLHVDVIVANTPIFAKTQGGQLVQIQIATNVEVIQKLYFGQLQLTKITGFRDEISGQIILPDGAEIIADGIDIAEVERSWLRIPSLETLAVKPSMTLRTYDFYPAHFSGQ